MHQQPSLMTQKRKPDSSAYYYLMKNAIILRLESLLEFESLPYLIKKNLLNPKDSAPLNQEQANYRVAIFRDEILELTEYKERVFGILQ